MSALITPPRALAQVNARHSSPKIIIIIIIIITTTITIIIITTITIIIIIIIIIIITITITIIVIIVIVIAKKNGVGSYLCNHSCLVGSYVPG
jgi:amino acid transporter